ncbi:hypothetical protein MKW98_009841, partial [Papaver atlanticum]
MAKSPLWSKWSKKEWIISVIGFTVLSLAIILTLDSSSSSSDRVPNQNQITTPLLDEESLVDLILLQNAQQKGAVCLDGSAPGYHFSKGFDSGSENWLLHIE